MQRINIDGHTKAWVAWSGKVKYFIPFDAHEPGASKIARMRFLEFLEELDKREHDPR